MNKMQETRKETRTLGGKTISVAVVRTPDEPATIPAAAEGLTKGMRLTLGYFARPSKVVTQQYPENRATLKFPARYRAALKMVYDEQGYHRCTGCGLCAKACPNGSLQVLTRKGPVTGKNELNHYIWRMDSCTVCNACVQACPFGALEMGPAFENAVCDRRLLIFSLNRYAGPPASVLTAQPDEALRRQMMEPRGPYDGPVPLNGTPLPVVKPLVVAGAQEKT
jgi:NADH-quinone oxidoreductase subunit I